MHQNDDLTLRRIHRFVGERLTPAVFRARHPLSIEAWHAPGEPVTFEEARRGEYAPFEVGTVWGEPWSTTWFHLTGAAPADWALAEDEVIEINVDLGFNGQNPGFQAEGMAFRPDGTILEAISPKNQAVRLQDVPADAVDVWLEGAGNPDVTGGMDFSAPTPYGVPEARDLGPQYTFRSADLVVRDLTVWDLVHDVQALLGVVEILPVGSPRRAQVLRGLDTLVDLVDPEDVAGTAQAGRDHLAPLLAKPAYASTHVNWATGHAHIDSAWLWPTRETVRKVARTFSNVVALMDAEPDFVFSASSAQQYAWIKERYPDLFERIKAKVAEGRFVPVGSMWVESDTNMPGGEAFVRQLVAGKRFFLENFGVETTDVWLPDSFGYSGAIPQLGKLAGADFFFTQKLCWNEDDEMPHDLFWWEGIDGTRLYTHFPPVDTYNGTLVAKELDYAEKSFREKAVASGSIMPFGYGDGGGGPTREMTALGRRYADLEGVPKVKFASPNDYFEHVAAEYPDPEVWRGEMYLEYHRGTYSSQARTKRGNRRSEHLLHEAELWAATAAVRAGASYPYDELERTWHTVLLNQFHDILPGSSIGWVYRQAEAEYAEIAERLEGLIGSAVAAAAGEGDVALVANAAPQVAGGVAALAIAPAGAPGSGASVVRDGDGVTLANAHLTVHLGSDGVIDSLRDASGRESLAPGERGNLLQISRDTPKQWDAWDIDVEYHRHTTDLVGLDSLEVLAEGGADAVVRLVRTVGASTITQTLTLGADDAALAIRTDVDWHERQKLLKQVFGVGVKADRSAAEVQFGHVFRNTHTNTSWDAAKFEICAHRWVHVAEPGNGFAVANDSVYGHDINAYRTPAGDAATRVALTLLRAPLFPDPEADQGAHTFTTLVRPGAQIADAVADGYAANLPARAVTGATAVAPLVALTGPGAVIETVKLAEDRSGDVVVRVYESLGARTSATLTVDFEHTGITLTDLLERALPEQDVEVDGDAVTFGLTPFQVRTFRISR